MINIFVIITLHLVISIAWQINLFLLVIIYEDEFEKLNEITYISYYFELNDVSI